MFEAANWNDTQPWLDTMHVCRRGHQITARVISEPGSARDHCPVCGSKTLTSCPKCQRSIPGYFHQPRVGGWTPVPIPAYCQCGEAFPWTSKPQVPGAQLAAIASKPRSRRRKLPPTTERQILLSSGRRCCICWGLDHKIATVRGQIAHLDHDRNNHDADNLAFLCLPHHDEYDSTPSQSKGLSRDEVRRYRASLYDAIANLTLTEEPDSEVLPASVSQSVQGNQNQVNQEISYYPRVVKKAIIQAGSEHVTDAQALKIREHVNELWKLEKQAGRSSTPGSWYAKLYKHFDVTSYKLVPATRFEEAIAWLQKQRSLLGPKLRRTNNAKWREGLYTGIWSRAKELGLGKPQVYSLAFERLHLNTPLESLTDLGERQLKALYDAVFALPRSN
jgi:Uncharacterized protein conserved in bacteria (DUF2321)